MKFGVICPLYDDHEYLEVAIEPVKNHVDKILFLISDVPWEGEKSDNKSTIDKAKELCAVNDNCELIEGHWENEVDQRNFGLSHFFKEGIDYAVTIDSDMVHHEPFFTNMLSYVKQYPQVSAFHMMWNTYWKKDYYKIYPREDYKPICIVKIKNFIFTEKLNGITSVMRTPAGILQTKGNYNYMLIPETIGYCFHMSYSRNDAYQKRKMETSPHKDEFIENWYRDVWEKWTPEMQNLHPVTPEQYKIAVKEDFVSFPPQLQTFIKKERMTGRKCSIIIPNWNSFKLLKRCLNAISRNTKRKNIEVIIVDNGSKDGSVEFIKTLDMKFPIKTIFNDENKGFVVGSNQGMLEADKDSDICLLNVDAVVQKDWLKNMYETMINFPNAGVVGPLGNEVPSGHQKEGYVEEDTVSPNLYGYCMLIMRELIDKIGYFDERYEVGGYEDNDYCIRTKLAGYETVISAKSFVKHKAHQVYALNKIDDEKRTILDRANEIKYLNKFFRVLLDYSNIYNLYEQEGLAKSEGLIIK